MKKSLLVLSAAALFFAVGCEQQTQSASVAVAPISDSVVSNGIAYFDIDSLVGEYDMYIEMRAEFEAKAQKADKELTTKGRALENDVRSYQEKVQKGLVTRAQAAELEQQLNTKQQNYVSYREQLMSELTEQEQVMLNNIHYSITEYLKEYNSDFHYDVILSTNASGPIYHANPSFNITKDIVKGLNDKYAASKKK